jgi:hypothetical protein
VRYFAWYGRQSSFFFNFLLASWEVTNRFGWRTRRDWLVEAWKRKDEAESLGGGNNTHQFFSVIVVASSHSHSTVSLNPLHSSLVTPATQRPCPYGYSSPEESRLAAIIERVTIRAIGEAARLRRKICELYSGPCLGVSNGR